MFKLSTNLEYLPLCGAIFSGQKDKSCALCKCGGYSKINFENIASLSIRKYWNIFNYINLFFEKPSQFSFRKILAQSIAIKIRGVEVSNIWISFWRVLIRGKFIVAERLLYWHWLTWPRMFFRKKSSISMLPIIIVFQFSVTMHSTTSQGWISAQNRTIPTEHYIPHYNFGNSSNKCKGRWKCKRCRLETADTNKSPHINCNF